MVAFWVMVIGLFVWTLGCYACCLLVVTAPIGGLVIRRLALARGISGGARTGAWYWAIGLAPWICYRRRLNGRPLPARLLSFACRSMLALWFVGPVIGGGMMAAGPSIGPNGEWMILIPAVNLGMIALAMGWRSVAQRTGPADVRLRSGDTAPFLFATIGMLSLLPQEFLMPLILSLL